MDYMRIRRKPDLFHRDWSSHSCRIYILGILFQELKQEMTLIIQRIPTSCVKWDHMVAD